MDLATPLLSRIPLVSLATCFLIGGTLLARPTGCGDGSSSAAVAPSVTWDGRAYAVAWSMKEGRKTKVMFYRFVKGWDEGKQVLSAKEVIGTPELSAVGDHFVLVANTGTDGLIAAPISAAGESGPEHKLDDAVAGICAHPIRDGEDLWVAWATASGHYKLARLGHERTSLATNLAATARAPSCSMAFRGAERGFAVTVSADDETRLLLIRTDREGEIIGRHEIATSNEELEAIRISTTERGWALLYRVGNELRLALFDGRTVQHVPLESDINPDRVDMTAAGQHFALTWSTKVGVTIAHYSLSEGRLGHHTFERRSPSRPRMIAHDDHCAMSWTELGGLFVWVAWMEGCPTPGDSAPTATEP